VRSGPWGRGEVGGKGAYFTRKHLLLAPATSTPASWAMEPKRIDGIRFDRPVIILSAPRSGSTLLFETLARAPGVYTIGNESHRIIEGWAGLSPLARGYASNRLLAADAPDDVAGDVRAYFAACLLDRNGHPPAGAHPVRFLEKTPKNMLRVPFLRQVFPDARFVVLFRDPRAVLSSMMDAWRSGLFVTYPKLPGWQGLPWSLLLVDDWQQVNGCALEDIVAHQWARGMSTLLDDLERLPCGQWIPLHYEALVREPQAQVKRLCTELGLAWDLDITQLPLSRATMTPPNPDKWRRNADAVQRVLPLLDEVRARAEQLVAARSQETIP